MLHQKNTRKQGDVGMGVAIPLTDSQDYDLIVEIDTQLYKVQVKTTRHQAPNGNYMVELRTKGGNRSGKETIKNFQDKDSDLLFIVANNEDTWLISTKELELINSITLGNKYKQYKL